jgi:hypothetical protein
MNLQLRRKLDLLDHIEQLVDAAVLATTREYAGKSAGGVSGGSG